MRPTLVLSAAFTATLLAGAAGAAGVVLVSQAGRAFSVSGVQITRGDTLRFSNDDKFLHQIFIDAGSFNFESAEQAPGTNVDIRFPKAGSFEVRCHIHPKMLLKVDVR